MTEDNCKCFLSVDLKMVPNGNAVGDIGTMVVDKVNRHTSKLCSVHDSDGTVPKALGTESQ